MNNVLNTKATVYRNLHDYKFAHKLNAEQTEEIVDKINDVVKNKMNFVNISTANEKVVNFLTENRLCLPKTQLLFVSKNNDVAINLFNGEHLSITASGCGYDKKVVDRTMEISQLLSSKIQFAYSDQYGYLMSDLTKLGSGIMLEADIMLSAITKINKIDQVKQNLAKLGYSLVGTDYPATYTLKTRCNLGVGEVNLIDEFNKTLSKLQDLETESAKMLDATNHYEMLDKVSRSVAILNSAHLLSYDELYNIIVNIRMGLNAEIPSLKLETINKLQNLVWNKLNIQINQNEMKSLSEKTKEILKGEQNV